MKTSPVRVRTIVFSMICIVAGIALMLNIQTRLARLGGGGLFFLGLLVLAKAMYNILSPKK